MENDVAHVAMPVETSTGTVAQPGIVPAPSSNATVPLSGTGETVAVNVTGVPTVGVVLEAPSAVLVGVAGAGGVAGEVAVTLSGALLDAG